MNLLLLTFSPFFFFFLRPCLALALILLSNDEPRVDSLASLSRASESGSFWLSVSTSCSESSSRGRGPEEEGEGDRVVSK